MANPCPTVVPTPEVMAVLATQLGQDVDRVSQTLQVSAAPVFMLTAVTSFLLVLTNRLHYIAERHFCSIRSSPTARPAAITMLTLRPCTSGSCDFVIGMSAPVLRRVVHG